MFNIRRFLWLLLAAWTAFAQKQPVIVPESHPSIDGGIDLYKSQPPDLQLIPKEAGGRNGQLWIRNIGQGLLIAGQVDGDAPDFPRNQSQILAKDHVEVWLAAAPDVPMPQIGWGNQFGAQLLPKGADSCADWAKDQAANATDIQKCKEWATQQQQYRSAFRKLFVRQWLLTEDYSIEAYATPAYELIVSKYASDQPRYKDELLSPLKPKGKVQMWYRPGHGGHGYTFQILIPYTAFPPVNSAELKNLWLMVDVFNAAPAGKKMGPYSSTSSLRAFGKPDTFNQLQLQPARSFPVAPCHVGLEGTDKYVEKHPGWFVPQHDQFILGSEYEADTFIIVNEAQGYAYSPTGLSPVLRVNHHFWHYIGQDEWVCGPELVYQKGQSVKQFDQEVAAEGFDAKRMADGTLLVKSGPLVYFSEFGSGQCGACPRYSLDIVAIGKDLKSAKALSLGGVVQGDDDAVDFSISRDWSQVVAYQEQKTDEAQPDAQRTWNATTYCLKGVKYEKCAEKKNVTPPASPLLKELQNYGYQ